MDLNGFINKKDIYKYISFLMILVLGIGLISLEKTIPHKKIQKIEYSANEIQPESAIPVNEDADEEGKGSPETPPEEETSPPEKEAPPLEEETPPPEEEETPPPEEEEAPPPEEKLPSEEENQPSPDADSDQKEENSNKDGENGDIGGDGENESDTKNPPEENNTDKDHTEETGPEVGPEDDGELQIVTNLHNEEITYNELENDVLNFYAYLVNGNGKTLKVKIKNSGTPENGNYLTSGDGENYQTTLFRNETNFITLYVKEGNTTVQEVTYTISYVAQKADEDHPTVGENPPTIITNLEGVESISNRNFALNVQAIAYTGKNLYSSNIEVRLNGNRVTNPTGGPRYEYQLYFEDPEEGDVVNHTVTVRAWDDEGNSAFKIYNLEYHFVDTGGEIGTAYIVLDATTVGLGIIEEPYTYTVKQNVPASYAVIEMLTAYGYEFSYAGTADVGFYLQRIKQSGLMDYPYIPENLWDKILQDELNLTGQTFSDSLGEFDYTQGSGWMFTVGGEVYEGRGLSEYYLNDGETLYLRFTLAYGKDIGGYSVTGGEFGKLSTYCGKWINDDYIDQHRWGEETIIKEATCTEEGEMSCVCSVCGDSKEIEIIPALEHNFVEVERQEPTVEEEGFVLYRCERCEEEKKEEIPCLEEETPPTPPTPPEEESDGTVSSPNV